MNQVSTNWRSIGFTLISVIALLLLSKASFGQGKNKSCEDNCFTTEFLSSNELEGGCIEYELSVSFEGNCSSALSHYSLGFGCGLISEASNSESWPMELNSLDPGTGLSSLKVDEIQEFGDESALSSFQVKFTFCPTDCEIASSCISPAVAYKAGQCVFRDTLDVSCIKPLEVNAHKTDLSCFNSFDGSIEINISGGESPYQILWSNGSTDSTITGLSAGFYSYTVTSTDGQTAEGSIGLDSPEELIVETTIFNTTCTNDADGQAEASVNGGVAPYQYLWNTGDTSSIISGLSTGVYQLTITDAAGCESSTEVIVESNSTLALSADVEQPTCAGNDGAITLNVTGGNEPYTYTWSTGSNESALNDLADGNYGVTVTDGTGCSVNNIFTIRQANPLSLRAYPGYTNCQNDSIASIRVYTYGGTAPFSYEWSNGETTKDLNDLPGGIYELVVTDANGCQATTKATVREREPYIYGSVSGVKCNSAGSISVNVYYGEEPYSYEWNTGDTTQSISGLESGEYEVFVTDAAGCTATKSFVVTEESDVKLNISKYEDACDSSQETLLSALAYNVTAPISYEWNTGDTTRIIAPSEEGDYTVTIVDANGCTASRTYFYEIIEKVDLSCSLISGNTGLTCGSENNVLSANISGEYLSYQWELTSDDGSWIVSSEFDADSLYFTAGDSGTFATATLTITSENGCTSTCSVQLSSCVSTDNDDSSEEDNTDNSDEDSEEPTDDTSDDTSGDGTDDGSEGDDTGDSSDDGTDGDGTGDEGTGDDNPNGEDDPSGEDGSNNDDPSDEGEGDTDGDDSSGDDSDGTDDPDNYNGEEGANGNDKECVDCFDTQILTNEYVDGTYTLNLEVIVDGECNFDLSHYTLELPECLNIISYNNSNGWAMELVNNDPTTGLSGIKVDNIPGFKASGESFTLQLNYTINESCSDFCWTPAVAYKAAQCVNYEDLEQICFENEEVKLFMVYPNPASQYLKLNTETLVAEGIYKVSLYSDSGALMEVLAEGDQNSLSEAIYLPQIASGETKTYFLYIEGENNYKQVERLIIRQ